MSQRAKKLSRPPERADFDRRELMLAAAIQDCLEQVLAQSTVADAYDCLVKIIVSWIDCDAVMIARRRGNETFIVAATDSRLQGQSKAMADFPERIFASSETSDLEGHWTISVTASAGLPDTFSYSRLLTAPLGHMNGEPFAVFCVSTRSAPYKADDASVLFFLAKASGPAISAIGSAERSRMVIDAIDKSPAAILIADALRDDLPLLYLNEAFGRITGYPHEQFLGEDCRLLVPTPENDPTRQNLIETINRRGDGEFLFRSLRSDGKELWNLLTVYPVPGQNGKPRYLVGTHFDVTKQVHLERERNQARDHLARAMAVTSEGILLLDGNGKIELVNDTYAGFFDSDPAKWTLGEPYEMAFARHLQNSGAEEGAAKRAAEARLQRMLSIAEEHEETLPDGRSLLVSNQPTPDGGMISIVTDITEVRTTERKVTQLAAAIDSSSDGIAVLDSDFRFVYMNSAHREMFGFESLDEVLGKEISILYSPDQLEHVRQHIRPKLLSEGKWRGEQLAMHKAGQALWQEVTNTRTESGDYVRVVRDVSERHQLERRRARLQEQLSVARKQEAISHLAAGVAHDFNNLVSVIIGSAQLAAREMPDGSAAEGHANRILAAGREAAELVSKLLSFASRDDDLSEVDLREPLSDAITLLRSAIGLDVELAFEMPDGPVIAEARPNEFSQVALDLALNARDALLGGEGEILIRLDTVSGADAIAEEGIFAIGAIDAMFSYARLRVADDGVGIDSATEARIFEHFVTTKGKRASGLGLAIVAGIVDDAHGAIRFSSVPNHGSVFEVFWPLAGQFKRNQPKPVVAAPRDLRGEAILVVDDESLVARMIAEMLEDTGASVASCTNPADALAAIKEDPEAWSLLVTDFDMPGMNGAELAQGCRAVTPNLPILVCTALPQKLRRAANSSLFDEILTKPFYQEDLVGVAAGILARRRGEA